MDPKHAAEIHQHLDKQSELLMEAYRTMFHELHRLQVEEEMLMCKLYEMMSAEGRLNNVNKTWDASTKGSIERSNSR